MNDFGPTGAITYRLGGRLLRVVDDAPSGCLIDMATALDTDRRGNRVYHGGPMGRFLKAATEPQDREALAAVLASKDRPVDQATAGRLIVYLAEEVTLRPTGPPGPWPSGRRTTGATCGAACSTRGPRPPDTRRATCWTWPMPGGSRTS